MRILICDDNPDAAQTLEVLVSVSTAHEVRVCHTGLKCVEVAYDFQPQVAFIDIGLPDANGYEVAAAIRASPWGNRCLLIAVTAYNAPDDVACAMGAGFDVHFAKSRDPSELMHLIQRVTGAYQSRNH